jgi:hypothetical protein
MKSILTALKTECETNLSWCRDITIIADEVLIPEGVRFPFIGLKDGPIAREEGFSETLTERLTVYIVLYQQILKREASVMGDGDKPGILDMASDVHAVLNENLLGLDGMERAFCPEEGAGELLLSPEGNRFVQKKRITYVYERTS